jgi:hypothetical protein
MDAAGERLTADGWYKASAFFVKPGRPTQRLAFNVEEGERVEDSNPWYKERNRAEVFVGCWAVGQVDSSGRFTSLVAPSLIGPSGSRSRRPGTPQIHGPAPLERPYDLVLTDTRWEFGPSLEGPREVKGPPDWRIETFEFEPWVTIEVAIRYLTRLRDESSSEIIKRNADKSIVALRRLR